MTLDPRLSRREMMAGAAALAAAAPASTLAAKALTAPAQARALGQEAVKGVVYESRSGAPQRQAGEPGLPGVLVSNGRDAVRTAADGSYTLPVEEGGAVFVIKPAGFSVPLDTETKLPRFSYIHQPGGTPASLDLLYPGLPPTGPLPPSLDFGLVRSKEPERFDVLLFADPQPESHAEIDFIREDIVNGLIGTNAAFGITAGDIMFDDLSLYGRYNKIIGQIGIPWWNIGGNHDLNFEAP
ncbi:MAG TPA: metallophosphoesterase N-terminal domain-containing protein, partial [Methylocella sp.]|nr:metallophosphoesterase N-terminal domain-containing protein [Methylocella sp.]